MLEYIMAKQISDLIDYLNECPKYNLRMVTANYDIRRLYIFGQSCIMVTVLHWRTRSLHKD